MSDPTWQATFVHPQHPWRNFDQPVPGTGELPPARIRRPGSLVGMPAYDVYLLSDSTGWPEASTFTYSQSILGELADQPRADDCLDLYAETPAPVS